MSKQQKQKKDYITEYIERNIQEDNRRKRLLIERIERATGGKRIVVKQSDTQNFAF